MLRIFNSTTALGSFSFQGYPFGILRSLYAINNIEPSFVADFKEGVYKAAGSNTTFSGAIDYTATSNGMERGPDGVWRWRPHNLLTWSEDFSQESWTSVGDASVVDSETVVVGSAGASEIRQVFDLAGGAIYRMEGEFWSETDAGKTFRLTAQLDITNPTNQFTLTESPQRFSLEVDATTASSFTIFRIGTLSGSQITLKARNIRVYRSDFGGMAPNPETGDSYVPTTDGPRYLMRTQHHEWDGSEWVNEGLLLESEQRTNLIPHSEGFTTSEWDKKDTSASSIVAPSPTGGTSVVSLSDDATITDHTLYFSNVAVNTSVPHTFSAYIKDDGRRYVALSAHTGGSADFFGIWVDLQEGVRTEDAINGAGTLLSWSITELGDGWYRVSVTGTLGTRTEAVYPLIALSDVADGHLLTGDTKMGSYLGSNLSVLIAGAQFEEGSTPSSYIPTSGSQATRAPDIATVDPANIGWPEPKVIGPELVTNGTFDEDISGWSGARGNETLSVVSGRLRSTAISAGAQGPVQTLSGLTVGKVYRLLASVYTDGGVEAKYFRVSTLSTLGGDAVDLFSSFSEDWDETFVATAATMYVGVIHVASAGGEYVEIDNISVREIEPLAVSIHMKGMMNYADEGKDLEARFFNWEADINNRIDVRLNTIGSVTGRPIFRTKFTGNTSEVTTPSTDYYTPGLNVPFNIASRHGLTFIQGAVDGTLLTENATPTALPDLSETPLQIAPDFMGTIDKVVIYVDDVGSAGLEELTNGV